MVCGMMSFIFDPRKWPIWAFLVSVGMLATAHAFEHFAKLLACPLCLRQREVYWAALTVAIIGIAAMRFLKNPRMTMTVNMLLCLIFLTGAVIATYHAGVEWHLWKGPTECSATGGPALPASAADLNLDQKFAVASCSEAAWRMFGISMAGYNAILSVGLALASAFCAHRAIKFQKDELGVIA